MTTLGHEAQFTGGVSPGRTTTPRPNSTAGCEAMRHGTDRVCRFIRPGNAPSAPAARAPRIASGVMDAHLELELRKSLVEREIRRQLFDYHEAMNRADYETLTSLL